MIKIFTGEKLFPGDRFKPDEYNLHHLKVLRVKPGELLYLGDASGEELIGRVKNNFAIDVMRKSKRLAFPARKVTLFASLLKKKKYEELLFTCSQIGVSEFVPLITERTVKNVKKTSKNKTYQRWIKKVRHGAELSMREKIPELKDPLNYKQALEEYKKRGFKSGFFLYEKEKEESFIKKSDLSCNMAFFIGPEGGFTSREAEEAKNAGLKIRTLGKLILDTQTACIAALGAALCMDAGD
ncbi:MAG: RsmE family RNA methyltransferase [Elusimicrobiota bacterium]